MLSTITLAALLLLPAQGTTLKFENVRSLYGFHGPVRTTQKFLPGDQLYLAFDIGGITIDQNGSATYTMALDVTDINGKSLQKVDARETKDFAPLGGTGLPGRAYVILGVDTPPGPYTLTFSATDKATGTKGTLVYKFEVLKLELGIVGAYTSHDPEGRSHAPSTGNVGTGIWLQFAVTGFKRDEAKKNQPDMHIEMEYLDESGKRTLPEAIKEDVTALDAEHPIVSKRMSVPFTRVGKFKVKILVTDNVAKKTTTLELPIVVNALEK